MIKAILVDDEIHCLKTLGLLLGEMCPQVEIAAQCSSAKEGLDAIKKINPELIFLDIEMPLMNGFQMLEQLSEISFAVIFTTSYDQYAIKAIRFSALDYLLKPVVRKELVEAVAKVQARKNFAFSEQFQLLLDKIQNKEAVIMKIAIPTHDGFEMISTDQIISCEADDNYTYLNIKNRKKVTASRTLKEVEEQLESFSSFLRVHHSYIVNLNEVAKYIRGEGGYLVMSDNSTINVSRSRKEALLKILAI